MEKQHYLINYARLHQSITSIDNKVMPDKILSNFITDIRCRWIRKFYFRPNRL